MWSSLIIIIYIIASYRVILGIEHVYIIEIARFYIGNAFFSIFAIGLSVKMYEQSVTTINKWIEENDILNSKEDVINNLNKIHNFFFGRYPFVIIGSIVGIITRKTISFLFLQKETGNIIIDTITMFLVISLLLISIGVIYCLYAVGSNGIKVKYPYEISNAYRGLASVANKGTIIVSIYLAIFGSAIVVWAYQYSTKIWIYIINILFLIGIFIVFYRINAGIRHGIAKSKQAILFETKHEIRKILPMYSSLMDSEDIASQSKFSLTMLCEATLILESLSRKCSDIEGMNEWMFFPKFPLALISTISPMVSLGKVILGILSGN